MDKFKSYDLHNGHKLRYFWPDPDTARLLNRVRKWIKANELIEVQNIDIEHHYDTEQEFIVFEATVTYTGVANA